MGLEMVELVMDIEREFDIEIPDHGIEQLDTLGDFHDLIARLIEQQRPERLVEANFQSCLWDRIAHHATRNGTYSEPWSVSRETRFTEDLGYG